MERCAPLARSPPIYCWRLTDMPSPPPSPTQVRPSTQSAEGVVKAPKIRKELVHVDFGNSAAEIEALHRAVGHQVRRCVETSPFGARLCAEPSADPSPLRPPQVVLRTTLPSNPPLGLLLHSITASPVTLPHPAGSCIFEASSATLEIACGGGGHVRVSAVQVETKKRVDARTGWAGMRDRRLVGEDGRVLLGRS